MNALNYVATRLKDSSYILGINSCCKMRITKMATIICSPTTDPLLDRVEGVKNDIIFYQKLISDKESGL